MARRKSSNEIIEQENRLLRNASITNDRAQRVINASMRYRNNIAGQSQFMADLRAGRGIQGARSRQYSRSTYMGLNNG